MSKINGIITEIAWVRSDLERNDAARPGKTKLVTIRGIRWLLFSAALAALVWMSATRCAEANSSSPKEMQPKASLSSQAVGDISTTQLHKPNAEQKLMEWLSGLVDFRATDFLIVIFTGVLASKTSGLYRETAALRAVADQQREEMLRSIKAAELSADAAKQSADALLVTERAAIVEVIRQTNVEGAYWAEFFDNSPTMPAELKQIFVMIGLKNYEKSPGTIRDICTDIIISGLPNATTAVPDTDYPISEHTIPYGEERQPLETHRIIEISWSTSRAIVARTMNIHLVGRIVFDDVFGNTWVREFVWEYNRPSRAWDPLRGQTVKAKQS